MKNNSGFRQMSERTFALSYLNGNTYTPPNNRTVSEARKRKKAAMDIIEERSMQEWLKYESGEL